MLRLVFMGSPEFAVPILSALVGERGNFEGNPYKIVGVITQPDRPAGRGRGLKVPSVKGYAQKVGLPVIQPEKLRSAEAMEHVRLWVPDLIVVAAFGQILRQDLLELPSWGCVNVHASLLPRWRGAAPVQASLLAGDSETGVTIMKMDQGVDTGAILSQAAIPIDPEDSAGSLNDKLSLLGAGLLIKTLPKYLSKDIQPKPQDEGNATYAPMLTKEDGLLDFGHPVDELVRRVRAYYPWPGAYFERRGRTLKVHRAHAERGASQIGQPIIFKGLPAIGALGGILILDELQAAGKKSISGKAFLRGAHDWED